MPNGHDKNLIRLFAAIDGFRVDYNRWPARILIQPESLEDIRHHLLTPSEYNQIISKIKLIELDGATFIAQDDLDGSYTYGHEGFPDKRPTPCAEEWLGM
jgi:hypothetical protein